jgi:3-phosphoshikimate 1-carboxyvinyltransferase
MTMSDVPIRRIQLAHRPLEAVVLPPGSKSITNRALVVASLAPAGSVSRLAGPLEADDSMVMWDGLRAMGVMIDDVDDPWLVLGTGGSLTGDVTVDAGASGTTARFLTAVAALADGPVTIDGTARMRQRPIGDLLAGLTGLGVSARSEDGFPPVTVAGPLKGGTTTVSGATSSQFLSAMLLVAPMAERRVTIVAVDGLVSRPYVTGTIEVMQAFGATVQVEGDRFIVEPSGYRKAHLEVEADASAAVYPAVAVAIVGGRVVIRGIPRGSTQPDLAVLDVLGRMGCRVERTDVAVVVEHDGRPLRAVDADLSIAPDGALAVAVACLFAVGTSRLRGLGTLRVKETDRLVALRSELGRLGATAEVDGDDLIITPGELGPADIETYDDHRMAMSFALAGLRVEGVGIRDPDCVTKTWPGFFDMLEALCPA